MRKLLCLLALALLAGGSVEVAAAPGSACPPVIGERESMLGVVNSLGLNNQIARLCGVPELAIKRKSDATLARLNACLAERKIGAGEISSEMQKGALAGKQGYEQSGAKPEMCAAVREQFAEDS
jgi:hypothetical protein